MEHETINALGSRVWNRDLASIIKAGFLCDDYGLDTVSTGLCVAFAMELHEKGILMPKDTDLDLRWGNPDTVLEAMDRIVHREEVGDILAEGVRRPAPVIGKGSEYYAMHLRTGDVSSGGAKTHVVYLDETLDEYYELRGWDKATGLPAEEKLNDLGMAYTITLLPN